VLILDALTPVGLAVWLLQVVLVWLATFWADRRQMLVIGAVCATFIVAGFSLAPGPRTWVEISNLLLSLGAVGMLTHTCRRQRAAEIARLAAEQELKASEETVKILRGLLPICAWCKKIRNESGAWEQMEKYIETHTHAEFSHGMCGDCAHNFDKDLKAR